MEILAAAVQGGEDDLLNSMVMREAFALLPDKQKAIVALSVAGYTQRDTAQILGVSRNSVGTNLSQALVRLRHTIDR